MDKKTSKQNSQVSAPPIVTVIGHVDHGKTTLLDAIRKTDIAAKEHGGITQKIGASSIELKHEGILRKITFIDTPGHEAFSKMRSRGADVADIALLIVSSVEGIKPQTKEALLVIKTAKIPYIVVFTKSDLPEKNIDKIKQQLAKEGVEFEEYGGNTPSIEVSAKLNKNIKELLDLILLVFDLQKDEKKEVVAAEKLLGVVIESKLDPKTGPKATVVIKEGILKVRDEVFSDNKKFRVRTLISSKGEFLKEASKGEAVEILGLEQSPNVGTLITNQEEDVNKEESLLKEKVTTPYEFHKTDDGKLSIVICADTLGSLEAILQKLPQEVIVVLKKTGEATPSDILFAKSVGAIVVGFNIKLKGEVISLAKTEKILLKNYTLIYELLDEIKEVSEAGLKALEQEILGKAKILASFPYEKTKVLGMLVIEGRIAKGDKISLLRNEAEIGQSRIISLRQGKESISKVEKGKEAGVILSPSLDFTIGDMIISVR